MLGTVRKLQRFFATSSRRALVLPLDHGTSDGLLPGLSNVPDLLEAVNQAQVQSVVLNKGMARAYGTLVDPSVQLTVQLSAGTRHGLPSYNKSLVCSVSEALRMGADAVSLHVNIGNELEDRMLADFGMVTDEAHSLGLPVMCVIYARGGQIVNELDPSLVAHCIRLGGELGADIVCAPYSAEPQSFSQAVASCPVPVLAAGGPGMEDFDGFLGMVAEALELGASGICAGRNVFMQPDPAKALAQLVALVHTAGPAHEDDEDDPAGDIVMADANPGANPDTSLGTDAPNTTPAQKRNGKKK